MLGEACLFQCLYDDAVKAYRQARQRIQLAPGDLNNLGVALAAQDSPAEAEEAYREALALRPDYSRCLNNLGVAMFKQGKLEEAAACYHRALEANPDEPRAYDELAHVLIKAGKTDELLGFLREVLPRARTAPRRTTLRDWFRPALGEWDEAVRSHRRALELRPDYAEAACDLGSALFELDRVDEAVASFRHAIELNPGLAESHNNLGTALARQCKARGGPGAASRRP